MTFISISVLILAVHYSYSIAVPTAVVPPAAPLSILCVTMCVCENNVEEGFLKLDCSRAYLSTVPPVSDWPNNITHLDVNSNNITRLDFELAHSTLQALDLSHNKISSLAQPAFGGLKSLKYLNLADNDIRNFDDNGFYGLDQLKSLNLSSNALHFLPDMLFYHFIGLQELSLSDNPLVHLDSMHFNRMISLRWLDLSNIKAYALDLKIFHTTGQLEFLDLSANDFSNVPTDALRSAKNLKYLRLNGNPIVKLSKTSFTKLATLEVLEMNYLEKLKHIEDETFSELTNLRVLEVKHNRHLEYISSKAFYGMFNETRPVLQELDLQGNRLRNLHESMVPCARLRKFNVQQNPWNCDCMLKWIKDCEIQKIYSADLKCASPSRLANTLIVNLKNDELNCEYMSSEMAKEEIHHSRVVRSVSVAIGVTMLVLLSLSVALVFKWRGIKEWYKKQRKGPGAVYYVRARANPREI